MHCPQCGQQQAPGEMRFCPRCGFPLHGVLTLLQNSGQLPALAQAAPSSVPSPRQRGVRQGVLLFGAGMLLTPILAILSTLTGMPDEIVAMVSVICFLGGLLRMLYAALFEEGRPKNYVPQMTGASSLPVAGYTPPGQPLFGNTPSAVSALPPSSVTPVAANYWRGASDTQEIIAPSVTEHTTRMLHQTDERS